MKQSEALEILKMGYNAFVTGEAGSGKTYLLNKYIDYLQAYKVEVGITASTGIAATHLGGMTIHAWSGIGIRDVLTPRDLASIEKKPYLRRRFEKTRTLIIDEVSMLHHFRLDLIEQVARFLRKNDLPFGGMQVVLCGDFFQLPPVSRDEEETARFAYHADSWKSLDLKICYLEEQHRQSDRNYLEILNAIRGNTVSSDIVNRLKSSYRKKTDRSVETTKLYTHNFDVETENMRELARLPNKIFKYRMAEKGRENLTAAIKKGCLAPEVLYLKKGARVMFLKNNFVDGYVNGTTGVVTDCNQDSIAVKIIDGRTISVLPASWKFEEDGKTMAEIVQYPLRLAWAITVHKSQGMSLDSAEVDLSAAFEKGMGYVALSRVRSLAGLSLAGLNSTALEVSEEVSDFDQKLRAASQRRADLHRRKPKHDIIRSQKEFIKRISAKSDTKKKKKRMACIA